jgi:hypothetical protein
MSRNKLTMRVGMKVKFLGPPFWKDSEGEISRREKDSISYDWEVEVSGHGLVSVYESELEAMSDPRQLYDQEKLDVNDPTKPAWLNECKTPTS